MVVHLTDHGWIKIHRKILDWEWLTDSHMVQIWMYFLAKANHKPKKWKGIQINTGQFISGRVKISEDLRMSERSVRTCIKRLKSTNEITTKTTNKYTIFTLVKWADYQINDSELTSKTTSQSANKRPTNDQQTTTNKNDKKEKKPPKPPRGPESGLQGIHQRYLNFATQLIAAILKIHEQDNYSKLAKWAIEFERLKRIDKIPPATIRKVLDWYCVEMEKKDEFLTRATDANEFRKKFVKIKMAMESSNSPEEELPEKKKAIVLSEIDESLLALIDHDFRNYRGMPQTAIDQLPELLHKVSEWVNTFKAHMKTEERNYTEYHTKTYFPNKRDDVISLFRRAYHNWILEQVTRWRDWGGKLDAFFPKGKQFERYKLIVKKELNLKNNPFERAFDAA